MNATNVLFKRILDETRTRFLAAQAQCGFFERFYRKISPPLWMNKSKDKRFLELYEKQEVLFRKGRIAWGALIQANEMLFKRGAFDCPAAVLYSLEESADGAPNVLAEAASELYSVKGAETDPELQQFADKLANEFVADWKLPVPTKLTAGIQCYYTTTMIIRKHLPLKYLSDSIFPYLVCPEETDAGMILPSKYWNEQLVAMWRARD